MTEYFTVKEFADKLKVPESTIRTAIRDGRIHAFRVSGGKRASYRIHEGQFARLMVLDSVPDNSEEKI